MNFLCILNLNEYVCILIQIIENIETENIIRDSRNNLKYLNISLQNGNKNSFSNKSFQTTVYKD